MDVNRLIINITEDVRVDLTQEFDRNFERKAFFDEKWEQTNHPNSRGSLLLRTGRLRGSINSAKGQNAISWRSSLPYASIHNEGGEITVSEPMKRFFWAMYYKATNAGNKNNKKLTQEALKWKALALQPVGKKMKIEQRQFIGDHPRVKTIIDENTKYNLKQLDQEFLKKFKP